VASVLGATEALGAASSGPTHGTIVLEDLNGITYRCDGGLVIDRDLNAARNLASLVEAVGTASGAGTGRGVAPANGRERTGPWFTQVLSTNRQDGSPARAEHRRRTVTARRQRLARGSVLVEGDR
jgi:hypothetical protein